MKIVDLYKKNMRSAITIVVPDGAAVPEAVQQELGPLKIWKKVTLDRHGKPMLGVDQTTLRAELENKGYAVHSLEFRVTTSIGQIPRRN